MLSTLDQTDEGEGGGRPARGEVVNALVLAAARLEGDRVGELCLVPGGTDGAAILGRAPPERGEPTPHLRLLRQRPSGASPTGPLQSPQVSRDQLLLQGRPDGLFVRNLGRCALLHNGQPVDEATVHPGDTLELKGVALFLATARPWTLPAPPAGALPWPAFPFGEADPFGIVGEGPAAWELRHRVAFVASRAAHVLVLGPSGAGKELVAQALHALSPRAERALVSRNAATLPEGLVDAELFGNVKNYPNPGMPERPGLIGEAHQSSLFLDEFGELPQAAQAHLLRVLDAGEYSRLGEARPRRADLRLIAATNRAVEALKEDVAARFRLRVELPDLNQRREDIPLLLRHLLQRITADDPALAARAFPGGDRRRPPLLGLSLVRALLRRRYTTHVRELETLLWTALSTPGEGLEAWPGLLVEEPPRAEAGRAEAGRPEATDPMSLRPETVQEALDRHHGRQAEVVAELGLSSRHVLHRLIKRFGLRSGRPGEG